MSHVAVLKAIKTGRIGRLKDGTIDPDDADRRWAGSTDPSKPKGTRSRGAPARPEEPAPREVDVGRGPEPESTGSSYLAARALRESYAAREARLRFRRLEGTSVEAEDVRRAGFEAGRRVREVLLELPERIAARIGPLSTEERAALGDEVERVLGELGHAEEGDSSAAEDA